jgi:hypothetical protein
VQKEKYLPRLSRLSEVSVANVKPAATLFLWRILCFLRVLLFHYETKNMHALFAKADGLSGDSIGAATEVNLP